MPAVRDGQPASGRSRARAPRPSAAAILTQEPPPLARFAPQTPAELERIVTKLLKKEPEQPLSDREGSVDRPADAEGRAGVSSSSSDERRCRRRRTSRVDPRRRRPPPRRIAPRRLSDASRPAQRRSRRAVWHGRRRAARRWPAVAWFAWRTANVRWASAPRRTEWSALADAKRYAEAYDLAVAARAVRAGRPDDREPDADDLRHGVGDDRAAGSGGLPETIRRRRQRPRRGACWGRRR